jgi:hypothetical protein
VTPHFVQLFKLDLLNFDQTFPLPRQEMVKFLVQLPNLELRLQIDLLVMRCSKTILCFLAILTHHDNRCLDRGKARKDEIEQNRYPRACPGS